MSFAEDNYGIQYQMRTQGLSDRAILSRANLDAYILVDEDRSIIESYRGLVSRIDTIQADLTSINYQIQELKSSDTVDDNRMEQLIKRKESIEKKLRKLYNQCSYMQSNPPLSIIVQSERRRIANETPPSRQHDTDAWQAKGLYSEMSDNSSKKLETGAPNLHSRLKGLFKKKKE